MNDPEYRELIISRLDRTDRALDKLGDSVSDLGKDIVHLDATLQNVDRSVARIAAVDEAQTKKIVEIEKDLAVTKAKALGIAAGVSLVIGAAWKIIETFQ